MSSHKRHNPAFSDPSSRKSSFTPAASEELSLSIFNCQQLGSALTIFSSRDGAFLPLYGHLTVKTEHVLYVKFFKLQSRFVYFVFFYQLEKVFIRLFPSKVVEQNRDTPVSGFQALCDEDCSILSTAWSHQHL